MIQLTITFEELLELTKQLTPEQQQSLVNYLQSNLTTQERPPLDFPVIDIGDWPDDWSLKREDWYDDKEL